MENYYNYFVNKGNHPNKLDILKEEYKYIESVWNVKNYITGQHHFLVNFAPII